MYVFVEVKHELSCYTSDRCNFVLFGSPNTFFNYYLLEMHPLLEHSVRYRRNSIVGCRRCSDSNVPVSARGRVEVFLARMDL